MPNETDQFLDGLKENDGTVDNFEANLNPEEPKPSEEDIDPEEAPESVKDRRHRRLEAKLQAEREANIAMATRLEVLAEASKSTQSDSEYLKQVERIYGTDTPEAVAATELLKGALQGARKEAVEEALATFREEQAKVSASVLKEEQTLDSMIEELEDENGVTLTKDQQRGFFTLLERLSPKDADGNVKEYADHHAVWEEYKSKLAKKPDNRAKDLSSRSMTQSGASGDSKLLDDSSLRFLRENDLI